MKLTKFVDCMVLALFSVVIASSCDKSVPDEWPVTDGAVPVISLKETNHQTEPGNVFFIQGKITDADGLASVVLKCPELYLDKVIDIISIYHEPLKEYDLKFRYKLDNEEIGERFVIKVIANDVAGKSSEQDMTVSLDGDITNPTFTESLSEQLTVLIKEETKFDMKFTVADNRGLDYMEISIPEIGFQKKVDCNNRKTFKYVETIVVPNEEKILNATVRVYDINGLTVEKVCKINVALLPDFADMYLADVATVEELTSDVFGVPMPIEHVGEFKYEANYYCSKPNTEIFFIPQKNDFSPVCFGVSPDDNKVLVDDPKVACPIVLPESNRYYKISFDIKKATYEVSSYSVEEALNPLPQALGSDYYLDKNQPQYVVPFEIGILYSSPSNVIVMQADPNNPNLLYTEKPIELKKGCDFEGKEGDLNFVIHNKHDWGWWDYCTWRAISPDKPDIFHYYTKSTSPNPEWNGYITKEDNWGKASVKATGKYRMYFDMHLDRAKLVQLK